MIASFTLANDGIFFISTLVPNLSEPFSLIDTFTSHLIWPKSSLASLTLVYKNIFLKASKKDNASSTLCIQGSVTVSRSGTPALL